MATVGYGDISAVAIKVFSLLFYNHLITILLPFYYYHYYLYNILQLKINWITLIYSFNLILILTALIRL